MQKISLQKSQPETRTFYCQVDTYQGRKDYLRGGRCVRLVGVEKRDYELLNQNEIEDGVRTFVVDFDVPSFLRRAHSAIWKGKNHGEELARLEQELDDQSIWYEIILEEVETEYSYFYPTFSTLPPTYFAAKTVRQVEGPNLPAKQVHKNRPTAFLITTKVSQSLTTKNIDTEKLNFSAFHVGQGMCSMVHGQRLGVMFDAGAGKPVTRERYLSGHMKNELKSLVEDFERIPYFVLSHFDNDHWNMLAWDQTLRDKIETIIVPEVNKRSARSIAFFDTQVKNKVVEESSASIPLSNTASIEIRRTQPSASDNNGHGLVSLIDIDGRFALAAGDYVYCRMKTDNELAIAGWRKVLYSAVIVPHHGDEASSHDLPGCTVNAVAFFSAGTHATWNHPSLASKNGHVVKGFKVIDDHTQMDIIQKILI